MSKTPDELMLEGGISNLPVILGFDEQGSTALVDTHIRVVKTADTEGAQAAKAVAGTYEKLADDYIKHRLSKIKEGKTMRQYRLARGGMLIQLAAIWRQANMDKPALRTAFIEALNRAIDYCRLMRWHSVATVLNNEKQRFQNANV